MARIKKYFFILLVPFVVTTHANPLSAETPTDVLSLKEENFEHIKFSRVKPSHYIYHDQQLQIDVDDSASFLMQTFDPIKQITQVSFEWSNDGIPQIKDAQHEEQRDGDDAVFKLGLLLKTGDSFPNPFIPKWMKRVETLLKHPSENMIYLVANAKHATGQRWGNPYNKRVTMIAVDSVLNKSSGDNQSWKQANFQFETPVNVVAIWLMADGDNTHSSFTVRIKNIRIE